jgi:uncharacterized protein (TIGR03435 family)
MGLKVVDRTGLSGFFDFTLEFAPEQGPGALPAAPEAADPSAPPTMFVALQQQLGLKLEPKRSSRCFRHRSRRGAVAVLALE